MINFEVEILTYIYIYLFLGMKAYDKTHMILDLVVFELWNEEPFTAVANAQKSGINVAELYWQGSDINSYFKF